ncbi:eCIS core domain-containing protein [Aquimarina agarilytica]|uniref:eCIS core domain-containing protein n=1 Tax=Aquimarina agarilytica TaxID=1087449 RepID=UPI000289CA74|nr:DUF4157 domain-containing protein [Aquimarina agarilytica]
MKSVLLKNKSYSQNLSPFFNKGLSNTNGIQKKEMPFFNKNIHNIEQYDHFFEKNNNSKLVPTVQKKCAHCENEDKLQKEAQNSVSDSSIRNNDVLSTGSNTIENKINNAQGGGNTLTEPTKAEMQLAFNANFNTVKIHTDTKAIDMNNQIGAKAFTYKNDIFFNKNKYNPTSKEGKKLIAHELTHVVQQNPSISKNNTTGIVKPSIQRNLEPPGNCLRGIHDGYQRSVKAWCDHPSGRACTAGDSCSRLQQKIRRNQMCALARNIINVRCYDGGDLGHRIAERDARRAQGTCMAIYRAKCERREPPRVPVPIPETSPDFMERMSQITGLTGAALILYLIVSEGSRLFPPRNLVPIP